MRHAGELMMGGVVCAMLVSCAVTPPYEQPEIGANIPEMWGAEHLAEHISAGWIASFGDEKLNQVVVEALKSNHNLKVTAARLGEAREDAVIAGAGMIPQIDLSTGGGKAQTLSRNDFSDDSFDGFIRSRSTSLGLSLDVSWELDVWGRIRYGQEAAIAEIQASGSDYLGAELSLAAQTAKAWFAATEAMLQLELAKKTVNSRNQTSELVLGRFKRGIAETLDVHLARSDEASAEALVESAEIDVKITLRDLEVLLGRYPSGVVEVAPDLTAVPPPIPVGVPADVLQRRPDLIAAERRVASAIKLRSEAKVARLPRISLTASGGTSSDALMDLVDPKYNVWNFAVNLLTPIIDGGRLSAEARKADKQVQAAVANYGNTALTAFNEVETALTNERRLRTQEERLILAEKELSEALRLAQDRYTQGLEDILLVLDTERRTLTAKRELLTIRRIRLQNRVDLHLALGGDFRTEENKVDPRVYNPSIELRDYL